MSLNWIDVKDYSFNCLLMMERFQLHLIMENAKGNERLTQNLAVALSNNPAVLWYIEHKCPECAEQAKLLAQAAPTTMDDKSVRKAEELAMAEFEDFVTYTTPQVVDTNCDFARAWNENRLFELVELEGKTVLDVGSGSGRLAFAAAKWAHEVYASEPVDTLREYMREKIRREGISNVRVVDGMADALPYPDNTFDVVVSGHVVGDDYDAEIAELKRVVKSGGWLIDCPGDEPFARKCNAGLLKRGWEEFYYKNALGGDTYRYRIQVYK